MQEKNTDTHMKTFANARQTSVFIHYRYLVYVCLFFPMETQKLSMYMKTFLYTLPHNYTYFSHNLIPKDFRIFSFPFFCKFHFRGSVHL